MKNRKLRCLLAALGAAAVMAGCGGAAGPAPEVTQSATVPAVTEAVQESGRFAFGDLVWRVCRCQADGEAHLTRHAVVSDDGEYLTVTSAFTDDPDALREMLPEYLAFPETTVELLPVEECYKSEAEAQAAADAMNGVTE